MRVAVRQNRGARRAADGRVDEKVGQQRPALRDHVTGELYGSRPTQNHVLVVC